VTVLSVIESGCGPEEIVMPAPLSKKQQIIDWILGEIAAGRLKPGDRVPSERQLRAQFAVSSTPVRQAIDDLKARGILVGVHSLGRYVAENPPIGGTPPP
jgi:DNA-binding GntR family transcriptional regulator